MAKKQRVGLRHSKTRVWTIKKGSSTPVRKPKKRTTK